MARRAFLLLIATAMVALPAGAQVSSVDDIEYPALRSFEPPSPERIELDNGMVVLLLQDDELPLIDVVARLRIGTRFETPANAGLMAILGEALRTGGTAAMSGSDLDEYLDSKAATIEANIGTTAGSVNASFLSEDAAELMPVVADVIRNPVFDEDKIEVARTQVNAGIARQNDDPQGIMFREFRELVYGDDSAYAIPNTYDSVASVSRDDLVENHGKYFAPDRTILGVVGDFNRDEMLGLIESAFGDWGSW